ARLMHGADELGWVGEIHPLVARGWDLEGAAAFELDLDAVARLTPGPVTFEPVPAYPPLVQDIAIVMAFDLPVRDIAEEIRGAAGALLASVAPFDVYRGEPLAEDERSVAFRLRFQSLERTLTDEDVAGVREAIATAVGAKGARLRD
ncbi:MAG: phenylalanine--tRNA ligase subunit beta, partial [Thermoleophilaceae bacterium]|nr:phenylalanine--tRNA ligase subunit beta [Thermoleophilaceae bacterium]